MTRKIEAAARAVAHAATEIVAVNCQDGPASIQGYLDVSACVPGLMDVVSQYPDVDAIVVACFDDTGVDVVRSVTSASVIGVGEAAYHAASMISPTFSVVTTLSRSLEGWRQICCAMVWTAVVFGCGLRTCRF